MDDRFYIPVILGSTRRGRLSPRVARFLVERMRRTGRIDTEILDLAEYNLPIMEERLYARDDAPAAVREMAAKLARADAIVIVSPEYNKGYPGVLKNALDYFLPEYKRKPVGIATVSSGDFGGVNCLAQLRLVIFNLGAFPIPAAFPVPRVQDNFDEEGNPRDPKFEKWAETFLAELLWLTEAVTAQKARGK
jgi:NAD(P)H-dependent FMN reductase